MFVYWRILKFMKWTRLKLTCIQFSIFSKLAGCCLCGRYKFVPETSLIERISPADDTGQFSNVQFDFVVI